MIVLWCYIGYLLPNPLTIYCIDVLGRVKVFVFIVIKYSYFLIFLTPLGDTNECLWDKIWFFTHTISVHFEFKRFLRWRREVAVILHYYTSVT